MSVLRFYSEAEWNPEDWERCSTCKGDGKGYHDDFEAMGYTTPPCPACDGHGSLKAAALHELAVVGRAASHPLDGPVVVRCEGCQHPHSEGTWEQPKINPHLFDPEQALDVAERLLAEGEQHPDIGRGCHYSRCDELCNHGGPGRKVCAGCGWTWRPNYPCYRCGKTESVAEASWRPVDVRRLSWDHDLRRSQLAVLCLRCFANQRESS